MFFQSHTITAIIPQKGYLQEAHKGLIHRMPTILGWGSQWRTNPVVEKGGE